MEPADQAVSARMKRQRVRDTQPEMALRQLLHARGIRYRVDCAPLPGVRRRADLVFSRLKLAVYVDGCFWHVCPVHATWPKQNAAWWRAKLERNQVRDAQTDAELRRCGWTVVRIWEHEDPTSAADRVCDTIDSLRCAL